MGLFCGAFLWDPVVGLLSRLGYLICLFSCGENIVGVMRSQRVNTSVGLFCVTLL